jgi:hypothetical protein
MRRGPSTIHYVTVSANEYTSPEYFMKNRKDFTHWAIPETSIACVIKGLPSVDDRCTFECLADERLGGVKRPG